MKKMGFQNKNIFIYLPKQPTLFKHEMHLYLENKSVICICILFKITFSWYYLYILATNVNQT